MSRIRLLSELVANQIAAGEVVERPASVVKELVENSLDADAKRVAIEVDRGGRSLIRVTDDGNGMGRDDALLCLERHATSKIRSSEDLNSIATMGFRGEAIPSIASVSRVTITSRERDGESVSGTRVVVHGGRIVEVSEAGAPPGTSVEVRQLFFNVPARRKFLRSEETERSHIQHYVTLAALAFPEVAFSFTHNQRLVWQLPPATGPNRAERLRERLRALYGSGLNLLPLDCSESISAAAWERPDDAEAEDYFRVWGFIGAPGVSRATRDEQHLFVNRRPVENRGLNFALLEGYHTALMKGRYPVCCLFLEAPPAAVDVNIHPAKREVKFRRESEVRRIVAASVRQTLYQFHQSGARPVQTPAKESPTPSRAASTEASEPSHSTPPVHHRSREADGLTVERQSPGSASQPEPDRVPSPRPTHASEPTVQPRRQEVEPTDAHQARAQPPATAQAAEENSFSPERVASQPDALRVGAKAEAAPLQTMPTASPVPAASPLPLLQIPLRLIGVVGKLYVLLESDRGLVLMDQHAAHERILFEEMLRRVEEGGASSQRLLLPETIELSTRDAQFVKEQLPTLTRLGVGLAEFGDRTFLLDAVPPFVKAVGAKEFVLHLIDELKSSGESVNSWRLGEDLVAKTVCRHAVKAHDPLSQPELERLLQDLRRCQMPYTCPHGRPTLIEIGFRELEKKFGRVV